MKRRRSDEKLIISNWKMYLTLEEARKLIKAIFLFFRKKKLTNFRFIFCPSYPHFFIFKKLIQTKFKIELGAQDVFWEERGAFTGEVSPLALKDFFCQYVILGHSERRKYLRETDEMINKKLKTAILTKLKPILCIGETAQERMTGKTFEVLENQLKEDLKGIKNWESKIGKLIIAYEPVWAIGTGNFCSPAEVRKVHSYIRSFLKSEVKVIYGGSVDSKNILDFLKFPEIEGVLIGGASAKKEEFIKILEKLAKFNF